MMSGRALFVYYKVSATARSKVFEQVRVFQRQLALTLPTLQVELMQRPASSPEGLETWMEVYRHPKGVSDAIVSFIQKLAMHLDLPHPRASELFVPLQP
jgi:Domain of unknown function (DUF4936)